MQQNEGRKTKNTHDVKEDEISDDDLDLPTVQQLARSIPPPRTSIISGAKTDASSHHIPQAKVRGKQDIARCLVRSDVNKVQRQTAVEGIANIPQKKTEVSVVDVHSKQSGVGGKKEKAKRGKKRKSQVLIDVDPHSDNERSKKKRGSKLSMAEAMYEAKKIDTEIQKRDQELRKELAEKSENEANRRHELVMLEAQE